MQKKVSDLKGHLKLSCHRSKKKKMKMSTENLCDLWVIIKRNSISSPFWYTEGEKKGTENIVKEIMAETFQTWRRNRHPNP